MKFFLQSFLLDFDIVERIFDVLFVIIRNLFLQQLFNLEVF